MDAFYAISMIRNRTERFVLLDKLRDERERKVDEKEKEKNANLKMHEVAREVRNPERIER